MGIVSSLENEQIANEFQKKYKSTQQKLKRLSFPQALSGNREALEVAPKGNFHL